MFNRLRVDLLYLFPAITALELLLVLLKCVIVPGRGVGGGGRGWGG